MVSINYMEIYIAFPSSAWLKMQPDNMPPRSSVCLLPLQGQCWFWLCSVSFSVNGLAWLVPQLTQKWEWFSVAQRYELSCEASQWTLRSGQSQGEGGMCPSITVAVSSLLSSATFVDCIAILCGIQSSNAWCPVLLLSPNAAEPQRKVFTTV